MGVVTPVVMVILQVATAASVAPAAWNSTSAPLSPLLSGVAVNVVLPHPAEKDGDPSERAHEKNGITTRSLSPIPMSTFILNVTVKEDGADVTGFVNDRELESILGGKRGEVAIAVAEISSEDAKVTVYVLVLRFSICALAEVVTPDAICTVQAVPAANVAVFAVIVSVSAGAPPAA